MNTDRRRFLKTAGMITGVLALSNAHGKQEVVQNSANNSRSTTRGKVHANICDFGAIPGNTTICTAAIQQAIDFCHANGGGVVVIPNGPFLTGTIQLKSYVHLKLEPSALLLGSGNREDYPTLSKPKYRSLKDREGFHALIYAEEAQNIGIGGMGTIDGQGGLFPQSKNDMDGRPRLIQFVSCSNVCVEDVHLRNSALWMQHYLNCEHVKIRGLRVWNHANRNNDMIDIDGCRWVTINDCIGDTDDDGITLKSTGMAPCEHVVITNCCVSSRCNAIKCGTESTGGFKNINISNCVISPSIATSGFCGDREGISAIALEVVDGGTMDGVIISNISAVGTLAPIFIRLGNRARKHIENSPEPGIGKLRNVRISNVHVREAGNIGSSITGISAANVENITLSGIHIELSSKGEEGDVGKKVPEKEKSYPEGKMWGRLPAYGFFVRHARQVHFIDVVVTPITGEPRPAVFQENAENGSKLNINVNA